MGAMAAAVVGGLISVGGAIYSTAEQKKAIEEAERKETLALDEAEAERKRIFNLTAPDEASATVEFGSGQTGGLTFEDFLTPTSTTQKTLGGAGTTGLTFGAS